MASTLSLLVVGLLALGVPAQRWNPSGDTSCFTGNPACTRPEAKKACNNAVNRWLDNGMYKKPTTYVASEGDFECGAVLNCNSAGPMEYDIQGSDMKKACVTPQTDGLLSDEFQF